MAPQHRLTRPERLFLAAALRGLVSGATRAFVAWFIDYLTAN